MPKNNKDTFLIADLCVITNIKEITNKDKKNYTRYYYNTIDKKIVYLKKDDYIDIETNKKYNTNYNNIGDKFIKIGSIIPFSSFLKINKIDYQIKDIKSKKKVKELYNKYKRN